MGEFRIQSVVRKGPVKLEKYFEKTNSLFLKKICTYSREQ